ncbi:MAG TPA: hypothetical protein VE242_10305 [Chthoniobacterales bacterium]|nr:hypothetical protein [Chthoniobacterales bacterium]
MDIDGPRSSAGGNDPGKIHARIQAELSTYEVLWLEKQSRLIDKTELLKSAVIEWLVRHPIDWFRSTRLSDAVRLALNEFIDRHKDEFLS